MSTNKGIVSYGPNDLARRNPRLQTRLPGSFPQRPAARQILA